MRRTSTLFIAALTRALLSVATTTQRTSTTTSASPGALTRLGSTTLQNTKRCGRITEWDPFERRGVIVDDENGRRYHIANTRAFETVLPTMLRTLEGAAVEFDVDSRPSADRVIIRNRLTPITAESYRRKPPVDFLSPEMLQWAGPRRSASQHQPKVAAAAATPTASPEDGAVFAKNILVDVASIPATQIARWSGPLSDEAVIKPTKNHKDMRSSRLFDAETNAYLRLTQQLGNAAEAQRIVAEQREKAAEGAARRVVLAELAEGVILAWSGIHRSGLIREETASHEDAAGGSAVTPAHGNDDESDALCVIRNVHAFQSALPTSQSLQHRRVTFTKVSYAAQPNRCFAENIVVTGDVRYDAAVPSVEEAQAAKARERASALQQSRRLGALIMEDEESGAGGASHTASSHAPGSSTAASATAAAAAAMGGGAEPVDPNKVLYGVVMRWSGGQGVIEAGDGRHFYLRSAADLEQLVDSTSAHLRGAVVQFRQDPASPRYACHIDILSTPTSTMSEARQLLNKTHFAGFADEAGAGAKKDAKVAAAELEGVEWTEGTLLSWSAVEGHGIIIGADGQGGRYVLRDPEENVFDFAAKQPLLRKGRRVKFTPFGSTGRLACNVVLLDVEVDEASLAEDELRPKEPKLTMDGNVNEAIPSPMSTSYWLNRMDKAGYDTREVKDLQNRALRLDEDEDDGDDGTGGGKFLDSEELLKKDPWWSDPRKNVRFPNSDMTAGHLALIGPASMMNVAMKTKDPKKLDKMIKKYQSRLTEEQKEYAWRQAKEMAPKYEECVRKGRERNEEPTFYFF